MIKSPWPSQSSITLLVGCSEASPPGQTPATSSDCVTVGLSLPHQQAVQSCPNQYPRPSVATDHNSPPGNSTGPQTIRGGGEPVFSSSIKREHGVPNCVVFYPESRKLDSVRGRAKREVRVCAADVWSHVLPSQEPPGQVLLRSSL